MKLPFDEIWACSSTTWYGTGTISSSNLFHDYQDAIYGQIQNFQTPWNSNLIKSRRLDFALHKLYLTWLGDFVDCDCKSRWISKILFLPSYLSMHVVFSQTLGKLHENKDLKAALKRGNSWKPSFLQQCLKVSKLSGHYVSKTLSQSAIIFPEAPSINNFWKMRNLQSHQRPPLMQERPSRGLCEASEKPWQIAEAATRCQSFPFSHFRKWPWVVFLLLRGCSLRHRTKSYKSILQTWL